MLQRRLVWWLCFLSLAAYCWPELFPGWVDPFTTTASQLPTLIIITMFSLGWGLPEDEIRQVAKRWPVVVTGTTLQYLAMPLLAWLVTRVVPLSSDLQLGLIMVGCVPGAMASNVLTLVARGNVSYSLSLTTLATCLSPLAVPIVLKLTLNEQLETSLGYLVWQMARMVAIPVVVGHFLGRCFYRLDATWKAATDRWVGTLAAAAILWIIAVVVGDTRSQLGTAASGWLPVSLLLLNLLGYVAGWAGSRAMSLDAGMQRALILEIGMQNAGVGTALARTLFEDRPAAMIPTALYTFGCMLTGTLLARYWQGVRIATADSVRGQ